MAGDRVPMKDLVDLLVNGRDIPDDIPAVAFIMAVDLAMDQIDAERSKYFFPGWKLDFITGRTNLNNEDSDDDVSGTLNAMKRFGLRDDMNKDINPIILAMDPGPKITDEQVATGSWITDEIRLVRGEQPGEQSERLNEIIGHVENIHADNNVEHAEGEQENNNVQPSEYAGNHIQAVEGEDEPLVVQPLVRRPLQLPVWKGPAGPLVPEQSRNHVIPTPSLTVVPRSVPPAVAPDADQLAPNVPPAVASIVQPDLNLPGEFDADGDTDADRRPRVVAGDQNGSNLPSEADQLAPNVPPAVASIVQPDLNLPGEVDADGDADADRRPRVVAGDQNGSNLPGEADQLAPNVPPAVASIVQPDLNLPGEVDADGDADADRRPRVVAGDQNGSNLPSEADQLAPNVPPAVASIVQPDLNVPSEADADRRPTGDAVQFETDNSAHNQHIEQLPEATQLLIDVINGRNTDEILYDGSRPQESYRAFYRVIYFAQLGVFRLTMSEDATRIVAISIR